jgi:type I restriction enzyme M protein
MLIGKDGHGGIERANSLDSIDNLSAAFREKCGLEKPNLILTNPPFGAGHDLRVKEPHLLRQFNNGKNWSVSESGEIEYEDKLNSKAGVAPEILFLEKCINWLKPDGLLGIVMAKGQLDNREALAIRKWALNKAQLVASINLHEDTFEPFCGSKASVLFFRKYREDEEITNDYQVFMAISNKVGQTSRGEALFKKNAEGMPIIKNGKFILDEDLSDIADDFHNFKQGQLVESAFRFSVNVTDIAKDSFSFNPIQYLPKHNAAVEHVLKLGETEQFEVHRLADLGSVFNSNIWSVVISRFPNSCFQI